MVCYTLFRIIAGQTGPWYFEKYFLEDGALSRARLAYEAKQISASTDINTLNPLETRQLLVFNATGSVVTAPNENVRIVNILTDHELHVSARLDNRSSELDVYSRYHDRFHSCVVTGHPYSFTQCFLKMWEVVGVLCGSAEPEFVTPEEQEMISNCVAQGCD